MPNRHIAVLGGGAGARSAALEFALSGHSVTLSEAPQFADSLDGIAQAGTLVAEGVIQGEAAVRVTDIEEALADAQIALVVVPTMYQMVFADLVAPHLRDGQHLVFMPGSMGSLAAAQRFRQTAVTADITISEIAALPYATRIVGPNTVRIFGRRRYVSIGTFPAAATERVLPVVDDLYPGIEPMANVLEAGLNNPNPTLHCLGVLLSASRIEYSHGEFYYYEEGMTPHVCRAIEAIDAERQAIGAALGVDVLSLLKTYAKMGYGPSGDTFWSVIRGVSALNGIKGPTQIDSRYLTEDVPIGLTIYSQLGRQLGVDVPLMESVIHLAGALLSRDFVAEGRTLEGCGIAGMTRDQLVAYVTTGS